MLANAGPSNLGDDIRGDGFAQKKTQGIAELSYWYHLDARTLSPAERIGYQANLPRFKAQTRINQGQVNWDSPEDVYRLFMDAFGDENKAQLARARAWEYVVERKTKTNGRNPA